MLSRRGCRELIADNMFGYHRPGSDAALRLLTPNEAV